MGVPRINSRHTLKELYDWLEANVGQGLPANSTTGLILVSEDDGSGNIIPTWDQLLLPLSGEINATKLAAKQSLWLAIPFTGRLLRLVIGVTEAVVTGGTITAKIDGEPVDLEGGGAPGGILVQDGSAPGFSFSALAFDSPPAGAGSMLEVIVTGTFDSGALAVTALFAKNGN